MEKSIISVVGKDTTGIIASVCTYLAEKQINILDISQTIVHGYFTMMMVTDTGNLTIPYTQMVAELEELGLKKGVQVKCQKAEIFEMMHRI